MITNKKHKQITEDKDKIIIDCLRKIARLEKELDEAKNLKEILNRLSRISFNGITFNDCGGCFTNELELPDTVLQYTEDILGGKVIKQEGNKCLVVDKEGNVKTGLTKQKVDKDYNYKLVR